MKGLLELEEASDDFEVDQRNLMVVDCFNLAFRFKHRGEYDMKVPMLRTIRSLAKSYQAVDIVILSDWGSSAFRKNAFEGYKNRVHDDSEEEKAKFKEFMDGFNEALELLATLYPVLKLHKVEADDLAAYIVKKYKDKYDNIWLISTDRDWDLLLNDNVHRFSFYTRKEYDLDTIYETHGCDTVDQFISMKVLMGDDGDTIPGVYGIGNKRAYNLIREYGSALDIYDAIPLPGKQQFIQNINKSADLIMLNYELMDLLTYCEEAINFPDPTNLDTVDKFLEEHLGG